MRRRERSRPLESSPGMLAALSEAIEARDPYARGHAARVTALAEALAGKLGWSPEACAALTAGGLLHDIGKLGVEVRILAKPFALTAQELAQVRTHPTVGARMLDRIDQAHPALPCVLYHHERWDGRGYPHGRAGEEIPVAARLLAVADAFDAMTSSRPYRQLLQPRQALEEIICCAGSQFDPRLVWVFAEAWETGELDVALAPVTRAAAS